MRAKWYFILLPLWAYLTLFHSQAQVRRPSSRSESGLIPISFTLREAGIVSLVIERLDGFRVRNLVSETWYPKGRNTVYWDGKDDLKRDADAAGHGVYEVGGSTVVPGQYRVRGIVRESIVPRYQFSVYTTGSPPWSTSDHKGGWLANHTPPSAALFVSGDKSPTGNPCIVLGSYVTEGPDGIIWVDMQGNKLGGKKWLGGAWTAAPYLAKDEGAKPIKGDLFYAASVWSSEDVIKGRELRVTALSGKSDRSVVILPVGKPNLRSLEPSHFIGGLAVRNGVLAVSLTCLDQVLLIDAATGKVTDTIGIKSPKGVLFDREGILCIISDHSVWRLVQQKGEQPQPLIRGLTDPIGITMDSKDRFFITDRGGSNQVKIFSHSGEPLGAIGRSGPVTSGKYDPLHMNNPAGLAVDMEGRVWVTEQNLLPKRVSVWTESGALLKAFYGPPKYGGGGTIDGSDKNKFYYTEGSGGMEIRLDWEKGSYEIERVYPGKTSEDSDFTFEGSPPETPFFYKGKRYFTNCYNSSPTNGSNVAFIYTEHKGLPVPVAAAGKAVDWDILSSKQFRRYIPGSVDLKGKFGNKVFFIWSDQNFNARPDSGEVRFQIASASGLTVMADLSFCVANFNKQAVVFKPERFTKDGVPEYNETTYSVLVKDVVPSVSTGGGQALLFPDGYSIVTLGVKPDNGLSISGMKNGVLKWTYPSLWPGLHASHSAPIPQFKGELIGTTRLLGPPFSVRPGVDLWALNSNHGCIYLFTSDGIFVATLFDVMRRGKPWTMKSLQRGARIDSLTLGEENFWPTITKTPDGQVYIVDGGRSSIIRLDGIRSILRLPNRLITVDKSTLGRIHLSEEGKERDRQARAAHSSVLKVPIVQDSIKVDGDLREWEKSLFAAIDLRGVKAYFNSNSQPYNVSSALQVSGGFLYAAYRTGDKDLLRNSGEMPKAPFKTGGALDLMISVSPSSTVKSGNAGGLRLVVTRVRGRLWAVLYKSIVRGTPPIKRVPFSSPSRTVYFDQVADVTDDIQLGEKNGNYELKVPLKLLGIQVSPGLTLKGDLGILRGDGNETISRTYWNNKSTGITSDVASEAALSPSLWGTFLFVSK